MLLGVIGDDFTGSSDIANTLAKAGMAVTQYSGVPQGAAAPSVEAGIVALKSRTAPVKDAVRASLAALDWLLAQGCEQIVFKYCSTFDSTPQGNIGPVAAALADRLGASIVPVVPSFPGAGRTVYQGHLFVKDTLLSESGMEAHPLTPMTDPDIRRWLALQLSEPVGHVPFDAVHGGAESIRARMQAEAKAGRRMQVVDTVCDADLMAIGAACAGLKLVTGGSGIAMGLPANFRERGKLSGDGAAWRGNAGPCAILAGSSSRQTRAQVARHAASHPALRIVAGDVIEGRTTPEDVTDWIMRHADELPLAYATADPETVRAVQEEYGRDRAASALEALFAEVARQIVARGVTRLIAAGGETSGAVVEGLGIDALEIGPEIAPGAPALRAGDLTLALKSGNFGEDDFFETAAGILGTGEGEA
jgi:uncharacterized protein YgbK (DUF1537 family)